MMDPVTSAHARESLYKRLGGYDAIAAFVADLMPRLYNDPTLWVYWKGKSVDSRRRGEQLLVDFLCAAFEGPVFYAGPDMKSSHQGLGITLAGMGDPPCSYRRHLRGARGARTRKGGRHGGDGELEMGYR